MLQHPPTVHVHIVDYFVEIAHRSAWYICRDQSFESFVFGSGGTPDANNTVEFVHILNATFQRREARIVSKLRLIHRLGQCDPLLFGNTDDGEVAVAGRIDIVGARCEAAMTIAGSLCSLAAKKKPEI